MKIRVELDEAELAHVLTALQHDVLNPDGDLTELGLAQVQALYARLNVLYGMTDEGLGLRRPH